MKTGILGICIALLIGVFALFQFEEFQKNNRHLNSNLTKLDEALNSEKDVLRAEIKSLKQQVEDIQAQMSNLPKTTSEAEKVAEIKYWIFLANTQLTTTRDIPLAIRLLSSASNTLSPLVGENFQRFQEAVKNDIETLQQISVPNRQKLWNTIGTLIEQAKILSPKGSSVKRDETSSQNEETLSKVESLKAWKEKFAKSLTDIKDLIKIRHHTEPVEPLLSETERSMIQQNLQALFEQIRLSLLLQNDEIFHQAIRNTKHWLLSYYEIETPMVKNILTALEALSENQLQPALPTLTAFPLVNSLDSANTTTPVNPLPPMSTLPNVNTVNTVNTLDTAAQNNTSTLPNVNALGEN